MHPSSTETALSQTADRAVRTENIPTPFLLIEGAIVRRNIERLAGYARERGLKVRPHTKTHKSPEPGKMQLDAGAVGLTVAKVGEAEVMAAVCDDLLLAYPVVDELRAVRAAALAGRCDLKVAIDSTLAARVLSAAAGGAGVTVGILVDMDIGLGRTGVASAEQAVELARQVDGAAGLSLRGLFCYPGHIWSPPDRQAEAFAKVSQKLAAAIDMFDRAGLDRSIVSGGSTPTAYQSHLAPQVTEIRPGTYIFNDMNTVRGGYCELEDCAARIIATVVSDAVAGQVGIDAGSKALTMDRCIPAPESGHGYVVEFPGARIKALSEEHGQVDVSSCEHRPRLGERVTIIPNHICPCVNLQDRLWWRDEPDGPLRPIAVAARGMLS